MPTKQNCVCLSLNGPSLAENLARLRTEKYFDPALDLAELRLDSMLDFSNIFALEKSWQKFCQDWIEYRPTIAPRFVLTLRKVCDGGLCPDSMADSDYLVMVQRCLTVVPNCAYIDLDLALLQRTLRNSAKPHLQEAQSLCTALLQQLRERQVPLIASVHDFGPLPSADKLWLLFTTLEQLFPLLPENTLPKLALMVKSSEELLRFYRFARDIKESSNRAYILLAMGEFGSSSRILQAHIGSEWTFCSSATEPAAPGQLPLNELIELYRYRSITEETGVYGVIGNPIAHSHSPEIHNPIYQQRGWDAVYLRFRVDDLPSFLALNKLLPIRGISCTIPHKEALAQIATHASKTVHLLGACNTFYRQTNGDWFAENTDVEGFLQPLLALCCQQKISLKDKKAAIIGAGGAARAAIYALLSQAVDCEIYNRTLGKAKELQALFPAHLPGKVIKAASLERGQQIPASCDLLIQTTKVGMGDGNADPIPAYHFRAGQIAYDVIYQPPRTAFLRRAERAGALVLNGSAMLKRQALAQIELFGRQIL